MNPHDFKFIRDFVFTEISNSDKCDSWFWDEHVEVVEKLAKKLLKIYPDANDEIVLLSVYFHDLGRAYGHDKDHDTWGANFAKKYLTEKDFDQKIIDGVYHSCIAHRVIEVMPETVEAKILATADAMSHFEEGFYMRIWYSWSKKSDDYHQLRKKLDKKIERDYHQKIFFHEAREAVKPLYEGWRTVLGQISLTNNR